MTNQPITAPSAPTTTPVTETADKSVDHKDAAVPVAPAPKTETPKT